jgi:cell wall assembly regulator SMI1
MHSLIDRFKTEFAKIPSIEAKIFNPPATESQILTFKAQMQAWNIPDLPQSFYDFYRWHDGCLHDDDFRYAFFDEKHIFSLEWIISTKRMWDELEDEDAFSEYERGCWWNQAWIPFLSIPDWWVAVIDTKGCFGGKPGQVISFDFKSAEDKSVCYESFEKWLEVKLTYLQNNLLVFDIDEDGSESYSTYENGEARLSIRQQIDGGFGFCVPTWKYRRKQSPENPNWVALENAIASDDLTAVRSIIEGSKVGLDEQNLYKQERYTPLLLAIENEAFAVMQWLVRAGADLDLTDCYGSDALGKTRHAYNSECFIGNTTKIICFISLLLEKGYRSPNDDDNSHPLESFARQAVSANDVEMLEFCLDRGLNVNTTLSYSCTSLLHEAAEKHFWHIEVAEVLVNRGIDKTLKNSDGETAYQLYERTWNWLMQGVQGGMFGGQHQQWLKILA